ncbi:unnamed protein product [Umbelopsis ramanniana]
MPLHWDMRSSPLFSASSCKKKKNGALMKHPQFGFRLCKPMGSIVSVVQMKDQTIGPEIASNWPARMPISRHRTVGGEGKSLLMLTLGKSFLLHAYCLSLT